MDGHEEGSNNKRQDWLSTNGTNQNPMEPNRGEAHCVEVPPASMEVHSVQPPPARSSVQKLKAKLKEIFFPDDPLRQFKGQPAKKKWILGAQYVFPILQWAPHYSLKLFKSDVVAGLTIASLAIPQVYTHTYIYIYTHTYITCLIVFNINSLKKTLFLV